MYKTSDQAPYTTKTYTHVAICLFFAGTMVVHVQYNGEKPPTKMGMYGRFVMGTLCAFPLNTCVFKRPCL